MPRWRHAGCGINSSYALFQDYMGRTEERALALGIGSGYLFPTTFEKELDEIKNSEMWRTGTAVWQLRPENRK